MFQIHCLFRFYNHISGLLIPYVLWYCSMNWFALKSADKIFACYTYWVKENILISLNLFVYIRVPQNVGKYYHIGEVSVPSWHWQKASTFCEKMSFQCLRLFMEVVCLCYKPWHTFLAAACAVAHDVTEAVRGAGVAPHTTVVLPSRRRVD